MFQWKPTHTDGIRAGVKVLFFLQNNFSRHLLMAPSLPSALVKWAALPLPDPKTGSYSFPEKLEMKVAVGSTNVQAITHPRRSRLSRGVSLDHGESSYRSLLTYVQGKLQFL
jgi:hypothetical protein